MIWFIGCYILLSFIIYAVLRYRNERGGTVGQAFTSLFWPLILLGGIVNFIIVSPYLAIDIMVDAFRDWRNKK